MTNYLTQIRLLKEASEKIQEAINTTVDTVAKGKMYATQDLLVSQIKAFVALDNTHRAKAPSDLL